MLERLQDATSAGDRICISAIAYAELLLGANSRRASSKMPRIVTDFVSRVDNVAAWNRSATEQAAAIKRNLEEHGNTIGSNDMHAISDSAMLIIDNVKEFARIANLRYENWVTR